MDELDDVISHGYRIGETFDQNPIFHNFRFGEIFD